MAIVTPDVAGLLEMEGLLLGGDMETQNAETVASGSEMGVTRSKVVDSCSAKNEGSFRAEIDTSAPFESVKEAVSRFGGIGFWKPSHSKLLETEDECFSWQNDAVDLDKLKTHTSSLEKDLMLKERETLGVLKELESTKMIIAELKLKLHEGEPEAGLSLDMNADFGYLECAVAEAEKENYSYLRVQSYNAENNLSSLPSSNPELILRELKQAKVNLMKTTCDIANIRTSIDCINKKLEKERISLEKTQERLTQNTFKAASLKEELNQTTMKLRIVREANENGGSDDTLDISKDLQRLHSEVEEFKKMGDVAKSQVMATISVIENTKEKIKTAEIRLVAARKMKKAARAAEAIALAEIKALSNHSRSSEHSSLSDVTLSRGEYLSLTSKVLEADEVSKKIIEEAMQHVDKANLSNIGILKRVEEATEEARTSKGAMEAALSRVKAAHHGRVAAEEALRKLRSDHNRNSLHNSTAAANHRREARPVLKPTLSIGQILSQKLLFPNQFDEDMLAEKACIKQKMSLGQMLSKQNSDISSLDTAESVYLHKQFIGKKKKLSFPQLLVKQTEKKKAAPLKK